MNILVLIGYILGLFVFAPIVARKSSGERNFDFVVEFVAILVWPLLLVCLSLYAVLHCISDGIDELCGD